MASIVLSLPFPPSVNTYYRRGQHATYLSQKGRDYKAKISDLVSEYRPAIENALEGRLSVFVAISSPTKRQYDIDNRIKPLFDALQHAGVFNDDEQVDYFAVLRHPPSNGGYCNVVICEDK